MKVVGSYFHRLTTAVLIGISLLGLKQVFVLRKLRAEQRELFVLNDRLERAVAPGEEVAGEWNLLMPVYFYASSELRGKLRSTRANALGYPQVKALQQNETSNELIYLGSTQDRLANSLMESGYRFREYEPAQQETSLVSRYYRAAGASIYFVSRPAHGTVAALSSKP